MRCVRFEQSSRARAHNSWPGMSDEAAPARSGLARCWSGSLPPSAALHAQHFVLHSRLSNDYRNFRPTFASMVRGNRPKATAPKSMPADKWTRVELAKPTERFGCVLLMPIAPSGEDRRRINHGSSYEPMSQSSRNLSRVSNFVRVCCCAVRPAVYERSALLEACLLHFHSSTMMR